MDRLILKCLQGEASKGEQQEVWEWLKDDRNFRHYQQLRDTWLMTGIVQKDASSDIDIRYKRVQSRIQARIQPDRKWKITSLNNRWKVAAIFLLAFFLGFSITRFTSTNTFETLAENQYNIQAPMGAKITMDLADGTRVWLNAGSKLSYSNAFNLENRTVHLEGEGYFEVAKNKHLPFMVEADGVEVEAVGTIFNVKAYPDEAMVEATLVEGVIDVSEGKQTIRLEPNQKVTFVRNSAKIVRKTNVEGQYTHEGVDQNDIETIDVILLKNVNTELYTSWRSTRWIFEGEKLTDFAKVLERRYDVRVYIMDPKLNDYKISGSVDQQSLEQLLSAVRFTVPIEYKIVNDEVLLTLDKKLEKEFKIRMK